MYVGFKRDCIGFLSYFGSGIYCEKIRSHLDAIENLDAICSLYAQSEKASKTEYDES
jgi:hypothetical protein